MTSTTTAKLLPGVERRGAGYRVRVSFPGQKCHIEMGFPTPAAANKRVLELRELRELGLTPATAPTERTLAEAAEAFLARKRVSGRGHKLRARGFEYWARSCKPWLEGELAATPLRVLQRHRIQQAIDTRAASAPTSARNELQALKAIIRYAAEPKLDQSILTIEPIAVEPRRRRALTVEELELLAEQAPEYARRLVLVLGTTGLRQGEAFTLTDDRLELHRATAEAPAYGLAHVTAELAKERLAKAVALDAEEVALLREQLVARAPGTRLVFPTATGQPWRRSMFHRLVWKKACRRAADLYRLERELDPDAPTPFDAITPHDLRATAATLMRAAGFTRDEAADRLGHVDAGELLDRVYDQGDRGARAQRAIAARAPRGLRATLNEPEGAAGLNSVAPLELAGKGRR